MTQPRNRAAGRRPGSGALVWLIGGFVLILLIFGWIVALVCVLALFAVGFVLSQQQREERQSARTPTAYPRPSDAAPDHRRAPNEPPPQG